jgi:O-antigen ligase
MKWSEASGKLKTGIAGLTALIAVGVFFTFTRSVWLGFLASAALFIFYPADRRTKGKLWLAAVALLVVSFPVVGEKIFSFKRDKAVTQTEMEQSAKLRPMFLEVATSMFQDRPIFGCGFGQYSREKYAYLKTADASQPLVMTRKYMQHNVFLAYLTETGLLGLACLLLLLTALAVQAYQLWSDRQSKLRVRLFGLLMLAILLNYSINGMFHDVSIIPLSNSLLFCFAGIVNNLTSVGLAAAEKAWIPRSNPAAIC